MSFEVNNSCQITNEDTFLRSNFNNLCIAKEFNQLDNLLRTHDVILLHGPVPTFATLAALPWIVPVSGTTLRRELEQLFALRGLTWPTNRVECTSALTLRRLIIDGDCIAALPELVALHDDDLAVVRPVDVDLGGLTRPVGVSRVRDRWAPPAVVAFTEHLHQAAARLHIGADPLESG